MAASDLDDDMLLGWTLIDLSDPAPRKAKAMAEQLGISVEEFIDQAIAEKVARFDPTSLELHGFGSLRYGFP